MSEVQVDDKAMELIADESTDLLPDGDLEIPIQVIAAARKHMHPSSPSNRVDHVHDRFGNETGITISYQEIFGKHVVSLGLHGERYNGMHINLMTMDVLPEFPVTVAVNRIISDSSGSLRMEKATASL